MLSKVTLMLMTLIKSNETYARKANYFLSMQLETMQKITIPFPSSKRDTL